MVVLINSLETDAEMLQINPRSVLWTFAEAKYLRQVISRSATIDANILAQAGAHLEKVCLSGLTS